MCVQVCPCLLCRILVVVWIIVTLRRTLVPIGTHNESKFPIRLLGDHSKGSQGGSQRWPRKLLEAMMWSQGCVAQLEHDGKFFPYDAEQT